MSDEPEVDDFPEPTHSLPAEDWADLYRGGPVSCWHVTWSEALIDPNAEPVQRSWYERHIGWRIESLKWRIQDDWGMLCYRVEGAWKVLRGNAWWEDER